MDRILDLYLITDSYSIWICEKCRYQEKIANQELIFFSEVWLQHDQR